VKLYGALSVSYRLLSHALADLTVCYLLRALSGAFSGLWDSNWRDYQITSFYWCFWECVFSGGQCVF